MSHTTRLSSIIAALAFTLAPAHAATTTLSIIINSPNSIAVICSPKTPFTLNGSTLFDQTSIPVPAGTGICTMSVTPAGWSGALALSGPDASKFALNGLNFSVGSNPLPLGSYSITLTATP